MTAQRNFASLQHQCSWSFRTLRVGGSELGLYLSASTVGDALTFRSESCASRPLAPPARTCDRRRSSVRGSQAIATSLFLTRLSFNLEDVFHSALTGISQSWYVSARMHASETRLMSFSYMRLRLVSNLLLHRPPSRIPLWYLPWPCEAWRVRGSQATSLVLTRSFILADVFHTALAAGISQSSYVGARTRRRRRRV